MSDKKQSVIATLQDDYKKKLSASMKSHEVSDLGITIYWKPENMAQRARYYSGLLKSDISAFVDVVIHRALNVQGGRMFKEADKNVLLKEVDPEILMEMANAILSNDEADQDYNEAAKN